MQEPGQMIDTLVREGRDTVNVGDAVTVAGWDRELHDETIGYRRSWHQKGWHAVLTGLELFPSGSIVVYVSPGPGGAGGRWHVPTASITRKRGQS